MKIIRNYFLTALMIGGLGATNMVFAAEEGNPSAWKKFKDTSLELAQEYKGATAATGAIVLYYGYNFLADYLPEGLMVGALAGGAVYGGGKLWSSGLKTIAADDDFGAVIHKGAKVGAGGVGEGMREELFEPLVDQIADRIEPAGRQISDSLKSVKEQVGGIGRTILGVSAAAIALWYGGKIAFNYLEKYLDKPHLDVVVKKAEMNAPVGTLRQQMIYEPKTRDRLNVFLRSTLGIKNSMLVGGDTTYTYRNLLLYGPPGTGKRMFAQEVAYFARMDFYEVPWSSLNKLKDGDASRAIDQFFKHDVKKSQNGVVIYIDNADLLFSTNRKDILPSSNTSQILNALVEHAERRSNKFLVVFGITSKPQLAGDTTLIVDDIVEVTLPKLAERKRLLKTYRDLYFRPYELTEEMREAVQDMLDDKMLENLAKRLDKASPAELAAFMKTLKIESELPASEGLTRSLIDQLIERSDYRQQQLIA